ncbi:translocon-associated protein subunit beta [Histomonas meleagridis]|uniref:translocon-associated protein subunit beta n=1 Tax=Histomonas meleagridis TaxID=135588 RepID=UPI003559A1BC|nr:translocon-associated protein subunit beta [Histomonas meleagridis]KAH0801793.1 translocon-associated protein subunit beta [Histomonas meleagridis]
MLGILFACLSFSTPFIMFDKKVSDDEGRVGEPVYVIYNIYNLGDTPITDLHIDDSGLIIDQWDFPKSASNLRWNVLEPGKNLSYVFTAKPLITGNLRMSSSRLRYVADGQKKIALSSQLFWFNSKSTHSIGAKANLLGYGITILIALGSILIPFFLWNLNKNTIEVPKKVKTN